MSRDARFDDEVWDEERWEAFLREADLRADRYMDLMFSFLTRHPRPSPDDTPAMDLWKAELRAFLEAKGWPGGDSALPFLWPDEAGEEHEGDEEAPALREEAAWEDDRGDDEVEDVRHNPVYRNAVALTSTVLDWAHELSVDVKDSTLVQFCTYLLQVSSNVAKGHGFGFERETLGGNIACAKRGLAAANAALDLLRQMKDAPYMEAATYRRFYERTFELRNGLALYILELRDRFNLGVD